MHSFKNLILRDDVYADSAEVTDENGFSIIDVPSTAVLLNYSELLGINHWANDNRASKELTQEQQHENARRIVACVNACTGISTENLENNNSIKDGLHGLNQRIRAEEKRSNDLMSLIADIKAWDVDQVMTIPHPLRERMQAAIDSH